MEKKTENQNSWKYWLKSFCLERNITFIDPTNEMLARQRQGKEIFYDHLTKEGHRALAEAFFKWFTSQTTTSSTKTPT